MEIDKLIINLYGNAKGKKHWDILEEEKKVRVWNLSDTQSYSLLSFSI